MNDIKPLNAGSLRHRVAIDRRDYLQNAITGEVTTAWIEIAASVPAKVEPLSGREYIAAAKTESTISARITIRYKSSLNAAMRIRHGSTTYKIKAILPDPRSGIEWQTLLVFSE